MVMASRLERQLNHVRKTRAFSAAIAWSACSENDPKSYGMAISTAIISYSTKATVETSLQPDSYLST